MRTEPPIPRLSRWHIGTRLVLLVVVSLVACCGLRLPPADSFPVDEQRDSVSLEEARDLAPFPVCLPTDIPAGIDAVPKIDYYADWGDPEESDVRLQYFSLDHQELVIEIHQFYDPGAFTPEVLVEGRSRTLLRDLLAWTVGWSEALEAMDTVESDITKFQIGDGQYWLLEIVDPAYPRASMIIWGNDPVYYRLYTYSSVEVAKEVVQSIPDIPGCESRSTSRP